MKRETFLHLVTVSALLWLCFLVHSCTAGDPRNAVPRIDEITRPPQVQVGIKGVIRAKEAAFSVEGPCRIAGEETDEIEATASAEGKSVRIGDRLYGESGVRVQVENDGDLRIGGKPYHGHLLILNDRGKVTLVNEVDVERYLAGVVGKEMSLNKGREALKSQVIAARTYALCETRSGRLRKVKGEKFDLYDDDRSQVYGGISAENDLARELVAETRGQFVVWEDRLVNTFYSSTCGGHTDASWKVLEEGEQIPPLAGTVCGYCETSPHFQWETKIPMEEASRVLFEGEANLRVQSVRILETLPGGHALKVAAKLDGHAKERILHANTEFRRKLKLKSTLFTSMEERSGVLVVQGRGWGHGAGLCQYGAYTMAAAGRSAGEILAHYYPGVQIKKLY